MKLAISIVFFFSALLSSLGYAEDMHSHETKENISAVESLSPELQESSCVAGRFLPTFSISLVSEDSA